jgi:hypothetical protein
LSRATPPRVLSALLPPVDPLVRLTDGDQTDDLIVVLEVGVEIVEYYGPPDEMVVVGYGPGEFIGEMGPLTGQGVCRTRSRPPTAESCASVPHRSRSSCPWKQT